MGAELNVPNYKLFRKDRTRHGGGVALYIHEVFQPRKLNIRSAADMEIVAAEICFAKNKAVIASTYNPKKENGATFACNFGEFLSEFDAENSNILVFGDTNRDFLSADEFDVIETAIMSLPCVN